MGTTITSAWRQPTRTDYRIEFIRHMDGITEPEVLHVVSGAFESLDDAVAEGNQLWPSVHDARGAEGFRVSPTGGKPIAHQFRGDSRL